MNKNIFAWRERKTTNSWLAGNEPRRSLFHTVCMRRALFACLLHASLCLCLSVCMYCVGLSDSWLSSISLKSGTGRSQSHRFKARERVCVCVNERGIESRKQTRIVDETTWQSCSLLYVVCCIVPFCSARAWLMQECTRMTHSYVTWHVTHS